MLQTEQRKFFVAAWVLTLIASASLAFYAGFAWKKPGTGLAANSQQLASATGTRVIGLGDEAPADINAPVDFKEFWDLWRQLKSRYYIQPVDEKKMFYGAMAGLTASLGDPYTVFFEPTSAQEFSSSLQGKFEGIGAEIGIKDDALEVIAPLPDTPADRAGLVAGDIILKINKEDTTGMSVDKAVSLIRGDRGTAVSLLIGRYKTEKDAKGKEKKTPVTVEVAIIRDVIVVKSVSVKYLRDKIALIEMTHFNQDTSDLFSKAVDEVLSKDVKGVILDVRNDPGGYLDRAIDVASAWGGSQVVVKERRQGKIVDEYHGTGEAKLKDMPTIVLVNQGSASASEIVAGALQDYGKAKLVGMKTFGKGSVQDYSNLSDKSAIKITIAEWLTPKDRSINKLGIEPDIVVDRTPEDANANRDPQLDKALELLTGKASPQTPAPKAPTSTGSGN